MILYGIYLNGILLGELKCKERINSEILKRIKGVLTTGKNFCNIICYTL